MGASDFMMTGKGKTAQEAFVAARDQAAWEHGHGGYTGTLAEKSEFVEIAVPEGQSPRAFADQLMQDGDERIDDKWGPAGCVKLREGEYLFFGWASS